MRACSLFAGGDLHSKIFTIVRDTSTNAIEKLIYFLGVVLIVIGLFMTAGAVGNMMDPENGRTTGEWLVWTFFLGGVPLVAGFLICRKMKCKAANRTAERREREILRLAKANNGRLTIADVSLNMTLTAEEAQSLLESCYLNNLAQIEAADSGLVTYIFPV